MLAAIRNLLTHLLVTIGWLIGADISLWREITNHIQTLSRRLILSLLAMKLKKKGCGKKECDCGCDKLAKGGKVRDACYTKVKSRYKVWPSAYASGALAKCRKVGAKNWGNGGKKD
jgi:hypothetical protein